MNRLAGESSPYLLQHATNPVHWYPWGSEALDRAKAENKPILLSIGYAACHWCHVMAHESFEDEETARVMNELFVNIKVDREERPDLDSIYMQAVQALTGSGGWPMTVFLTPDGSPFYGGTYFPKNDGHGLPSFRRVLRGIAEAYSTRRTTVDETALRLREIYGPGPSRGMAGVLSPALLERAWHGLAASFDERHAGFGGAPKFPPSMACDFLLHYWRRTDSGGALDMARRTFVAMARGGIYDQIGGGLHRYSVDDHWLVPHFEKMLYDNALFVRLGVHLWQATGDEEIRRVTEQTLGWLAREMTSPAGGFFSSLDADSEGEEGKFYVWEERELRTVVGDDFDVVREYWGVTTPGNFEGRNILFLPQEPEGVARRLKMPATEVRRVVERAGAALLDVRGSRVWPGLDDKILAGWNGLTLRAVAEAARVFGSSEWRALALRNADFLWREMVRDGRVSRVHKSGTTRGAGYLEDHAAVALALLDVYALTFDPIWLERALTITAQTREHFRDPSTGLFYDTARDHEQLITRPRDLTDNAMPSGQSLVGELLVRVAEYTGNEEFRELAEAIVTEVAEAIPRHPNAFGQMLAVADALIFGSVEVVVTGVTADEGHENLVAAIRAAYLPSLILAGGTDEDLAGTAIGAGKTSLQGRSTAYVCRRYTCDAPTQQPEELSRQLARAVRPVG